MLAELISWDAATQDNPEVMTGTMLVEPLLAPYNITYSGLSYGAWGPVDPSDDLGTCRCLTLREEQQATMAHTLEVFNKGEEDNTTEVAMIPIVEIDPNTALNLIEATACHMPVFIEIISSVATV